MSGIRLFPTPEQRARKEDRRNQRSFDEFTANLDDRRLVAAGDTGGEFDPTLLEDFHGAAQAWADEGVRQSEVARSRPAPVNPTNPPIQAGFESPVVGRYKEAQGASSPDRFRKEDADFLQKVFTRGETGTMDPNNILLKGGARPGVKQEAARLNQELHKVRTDAQQRAVSHREVLQRLSSDYFALEGALMGDPEFPDEQHRPELAFGEEFI